MNGIKSFSRHWQNARYDSSSKVDIIIGGAESTGTRDGLPFGY
jgi:hypothetical protein